MPCGRSINDEYVALDRSLTQLLRILGVHIPPPLPPREKRPFAADSEETALAWGRPPKKPERPSLQAILAEAAAR
jgi:hypothetical protein